MADEISGIDLGIEGLGPAEHIGRGGFADVYRAEQLSLRRAVAVKVLRSPSGTPETNARFQRECHAIGAVSDHPHIVGVHDSGLTKNGRSYLVMEYLSGGSLADHLHRRGPMPIGEVVDTVSKIARALAVAHRAGVLHRDVKPANIMISAYGEPALGDFGIARIDGGHQTVTGQVTASIVHAAPEILEGHPPSPASDIYSLGSTLFELAVGKAPYYDASDESMWPVMKRILSESMPAPESVGFSPALGVVFRKATARNPLDRYQDADELAEALAALLHDPNALAASGPSDLSLGRTTATLDAEDPDRTTLVAEPGILSSSSGLARPARADVTAVQLPPPPSMGGPSGVGSSRRGGGDRRSFGDVVGVGLALVAAVAAVATATWVFLLPELSREDDDTIEADPDAAAIVVTGAADGPLRAGQGYPVEIAAPPSGASFRLVVDGEPVGEAVPVVPDLVAAAGRHRVQVEVVDGASVARSAVADYLALPEAPAGGYRAHLARLPTDSFTWSDVIGVFDALVAEGHAVEVLDSEDLVGAGEGLWLLAVPGFEDGQAADEYCADAGLSIPDRCYAALVEPAGA